MLLSCYREEILIKEVVSNPFSLAIAAHEYERIGMVDSPRTSESNCFLFC